jgi:hypothetical protein
MSTASITHRPLPMATAAAAVVAAIAVGSVLVAHDSTGSEPQQSGTQHTQLFPDPPAGFVWHPTTSGGHVMIGLP